MEAFDVYCAYQAGLPLPTPPSATSDRGRTPEQQIEGGEGRGEGEGGEGKELVRENERLRALLKKDQVHLSELMSYGLALSNKLLEERADHAREVAALKEKHQAELKEAYRRMPAQVVTKRAGEGLPPSTSPEKRVCLSGGASREDVDEGDAPSIKSLDEVAPGLRPEIESWVETWRNDAIGTKTLKGKTLDAALPSVNCVAQRSKGGKSDQFCLDGKPVIHISCVKCTGLHRMCCRRDPSFREQNLPYDFVLSPLAPELRGNTQPCDRGHYVFEQELSTAMRKKYGKDAVTGAPSPSDGAGNDGPRRPRHEPILKYNHHSTAIMSYVPAFERRYKSIGNVISTLTDHASRDTVIEEAKARLSKAGKATTAKAAAIAKEVDILNTALAHAAEKGRAEDVSHLSEELNGWLKHQLDVGERTALAALRRENAAQGEVAEQELSQLRDKGREKDTRIRELEAATTSHQDAAHQLRDKIQTQAVTLEEKEQTIQSLRAQLEQQTQASVTAVTEVKSQSEQTRNELMAQLKASKDRVSDLERSLDTERARADDFETQKETN
ncbi:hypothetical protein KC333_g3658, partial [Hortaea werneckii]